MPEYVYAVHHFQPENEDELGLQVGECIEVVEKDDEFGDGWWQVRFLITVSNWFVLITLDFRVAVALAKRDYSLSATLS